MARPGVEFDDVARVAQQLMSQGEFPSVQKIRSRLGTGSNTTINTHLKAWQAQLVAKKPSPVLPESVPEDLMNPLDEFWTLALAKAEANYQKFKEEMEAKVLAAETAQQEAQTALEQKGTDYIELKQAYEVLVQQLRETEQHWHTLQGEQTVTASELTQAHAALDQAHALLQSQQQTFETERAQLSKGHAEQLEFERKRADAAESRLLQEVDRLRQTMKSLEAERSKQQKITQELNERNQQREITIQQEMTALIADNQHLEQALQQRQQDYDDIKLQLQTIQKQFSKSLETVEALRLALEKSKDREITLTELNGQYQGKIDQLQSKT